MDKLRAAEEYSNQPVGANFRLSLRGQPTVEIVRAIEVKAFLAGVEWRDKALLEEAAPTKAAMLRLADFCEINVHTYSASDAFDFVFNILSARLAAKNNRIDWLQGRVKELEAILKDKTP